MIVVPPQRINFSNLGQGRLNKKIFGLNRHSKNACNSKSTSPIWVTKLYSYRKFTKDSKFAVKKF